MCLCVHMFICVCTYSCIHLHEHKYVYVYMYSGILVVCICFILLCICVLFGVMCVRVDMGVPEVPYPRCPDQGFPCTSRRVVSFSAKYCTAYLPNVYVCVCVYISKDECVGIHVYKQVHRYIHTNIDICICTYTCIHMYMHLYANLFKVLYGHMCVLMQARMCVSYVCACVRVCGCMCVCGYLIHSCPTPRSNALDTI